jgi:hypothetical protein
MKTTKENFDKNNEIWYNQYEEWALVRKMFPWISKIEDKRILDKLLLLEKEQDTSFQKLLQTFYRSKTVDLIAQKRYAELIKYEWILELIEELKSLFNNNNNYGENNWWI